MSGLFPNLIDKAKENALDIPLFNVKKRWGMFDVARYYRDSDGLKNLPGSAVGIDCQEHFDPGLLSISVRSTEPGLELKDEFGRWIPGPNSKKVGVIWAGNAATRINPQIKRCVHRVICPRLKPNIQAFNSNRNSMLCRLEADKLRPRVAIWHEICTADQEHKELMNNANDPQVAQIPGKGFSLRPHVENEKQSSVAAKFEGETEIPMSKSGLSSSNLKSLHKDKSYTKTVDQSHIPISSLTGLPMFATMNSFQRFLGK